MKDDLTYYVDTEKKTVVCVATDCEYDFIKEILRRFASHKNVEKIILYQVLETFQNDWNMNYKYTGKASCAKDDNFDIEKGKKISRQKMRVKYNIDKLKKYHKLFTCFSNIQKELMNSIDFHTGAIEKHLETYKKYISE
jgi:hypothetical protein